MDVFPQDNSGTKKEGVSYTYKGFGGYAPIAGHLGTEGRCLSCELRPGSQHAKKVWLHPGPGSAPGPAIPFQLAPHFSFTLFAPAGSGVADFRKLPTATPLCRRYLYNVALLTLRFPAISFTLRRPSL